MDFFKFRNLIFSDAYRIKGGVGWGAVLNCFVRGDSFRYIVFIRICSFLDGRRFCQPFFLLARFLKRGMMYKYGISISHRVSIGPGFYIGHFGGVVVNDAVIIGANCNISHGVTLGQKNRGGYKGAPIIGDNVFIGPGAKILGAVSIGDNVAIGANAVVTKDIPPNAIAVGIPAKVIGYSGSVDYVNRVWVE